MKKKRPRSSKARVFRNNKINSLNFKEISKPLKKKRSLINLNDVFKSLKSSKKDHNNGIYSLHQRYLKLRNKNNL